MALRFRPSPGKWKAVAALAAVALGAVLLWRLLPGDFLGPWRGWIDEILTQVRRLPFPAFIPLAGLLPFLGIPVTAFYLIAGAVYAPVYGLPLTLAGIACSLALNFTLSHLAARQFRGPVSRLLVRWKVPVPSFAGASAWKAVLLVRIAPGAPLIAQNLLLGLAEVPFRIYLLISMATEMLIALGYLTAGKSFASGQWGFLFLGAGIIGASLLAMSLLRDRKRLMKEGD